MGDGNKLIVYSTLALLEKSTNVLKSRVEDNMEPDQLTYKTGLAQHSGMKIITIHHKRPCRIEISHPRGQKFNQGRGLPSPWLNSDPEGEISLSYMDRLMMDRFSPIFEGFL